jgi:hypothetical protein
MRFPPSESLDRRELELLRSVFEAAFGLCMGYDWNKGTAAIDCGYRRKLLSAVNAIRAVPDFEDKYRMAGRSASLTPSDGRPE